MADYIAVCTKFMDEIGFNPAYLYCQVTGKPIAKSTELVDLIESLKGDVDGVIDDVALRVLASMRPSVFWNAMREHSLQDMRLQRPIELCAYLLNRLFAPSTGVDKLALPDRLGMYSDRIKSYALLAQWGMDERLDSMMFMLLELDAKLNLSRESCPFTAYDFFFDAPTHNERLAMLTEYYEKRIAHYNRQQKVELDEARWFKGNSLARTPYVSAFWEKKPLSPTQVKMQERQSEKALMTNLLADLLSDSPKSEPLPPVIVAVPPTRVVRFGIKGA